MVDKMLDQELLDKLSAAHLPKAIDQLTKKLETMKQVDVQIAVSCRGSQTAGTRDAGRRKQPGRNFVQDKGNQSVHRTREEFDGNPDNISVS